MPLGTVHHVVPPASTNSEMIQLRRLLHRFRAALRPEAAEPVGFFECVGWFCGVAVSLALLAGLAEPVAVAALVLSLALFVPALIELEARKYAAGVLAGLFGGGIIWVYTTMPDETAWLLLLPMAAIGLLAGYTGTTPEFTAVRDYILTWAAVFALVGAGFVFSPLLFPEAESTVTLIAQQARDNHTLALLTGWLAWLLIASILGASWGMAARKIKVF